MTEKGVLYFLTDPQGDPVMRMYVPEHLRANIISEYHDKNGHFGVDKCYHTIARSYYWPNMFQELYDYIGKCVKCSQRNLRKIKPTLMETEIPPYPFAKVSLDLAGPFPLTLSGNRYVVSFVDWLTGWIEAFPIADKTADTMVQLLMNEIFPRFGCPLVLVTDNGTENVNNAMKETLSHLKIHHAKSSVFHPQTNAKVERSHRTWNDILVKLMETKQCNTWDLHLQQALAAMRFSYSDSTGESPFFLLYGREVVLPIDALLQPRRKYYGEETHRILMEIQHEAFLRAHRRLKKQKARQAKYADRSARDVDFKVGDPVFLKNHKKTCKLSPSWEPYYRIIEKKAPRTFRVKNQLTGEVVTSHAEHLVLAKTEWDPNPLAPNDHRRTRLRNVVSDEGTESCSNDETQLVPAKAGEGDEQDSENFDKQQSDGNDQEQLENIYDKEIEVDEEVEQSIETPEQEGAYRMSDDEHKEDAQDMSSNDESEPMSDGSRNVEEGMEIPNELIRPLKRERSGTSSEDDIPLAELRKRIKIRRAREREIAALKRIRNQSFTKKTEENGEDWTLTM